MKRVLAVTLTVLMLTSMLTGCGKDSTSNVNQTGSPEKGQQIATMTIKGYGDIKIMLFDKQAPKAVENFVTHAEKGYYNGLSFHRIMNDFMMQGGDPQGTGTGGESIWGKPFEDEFSELRNFIVDKIAAVPVDAQSMPTTPVLIETIKVTKN